MRIAYPVTLVSWLSCCVSIALCHHTFEPTPDIITLGFDEYVRAVIEQLHVPGLSVAVVDLKQDVSSQISAKGYGFAKLPGTPATADTLYYSGSTTKAFTAAVAAKVIQNSTILHWATRVHNLLPEFKLEDDHATKQTTIEDALSHRSGLASHAFSYRSGSPSAVTKSLRWLPMTSEPRDRWQYCNLMYAVVGNLLETVTGASLGRLIRNYLWDPLGMQSTFFSLSDALKADTSETHMSVGYNWVDCNDELFGPNPRCGPSDGGYFVPEQYTDLSGTSAAGAIISSANDYALWIRGILQSGISGGSSNGTSPFTDIAQSVMRPRSIVPIDYLAPVPENLITPPNYALGWFNAHFHGRPTISHSGGLPGYITEVTILPSEGLGVVTFANAFGDDVVAGKLITLKILQNKLNLSQAEFKQDMYEINQHGSLFGFKNLDIGTLYPRSLRNQGCEDLVSIPWSPRKTPLKSQGNNSSSAYLRGNSDQFYNPAYGTFTVVEHIIPQSNHNHQTDARSSKGSHNRVQDDPERFFIVEPSPHVLNYAFYLQPQSQFQADANDIAKATRFDGGLIQLHGDCHEKFQRSASPQQPSCGKSTSDSPRCIDECAGSGVWQHDIAYFEPAGEDYSARIGFVLEPEMVRHANEKAETARFALRQRLAGEPSYISGESGSGRELLEELRQLDETVLKESMIWFDRVEERRYAPTLQQDGKTLAVQMYS